MSTLLINQYYQNLDRTLQYGKSSNEQALRNHFWVLLNSYAREFNYEVVPEVAVMGTKGKKVYPDGTVKNLWGLDIGFWESKDEKDDINAEIDSKIKKGYPLTNILFEDSNMAYLYQRGAEVAHVKVREADKLNSLLTEFLSFKSDTVFRFEDAIEKFKADIPTIVKILRSKILETRESNIQFLTAQEAFLQLCKAEINPDITIEDIREMLIQHILTSDIFNKIFDDPEFHLHNTIAAELEKLISILFTYSQRKNLLYSIEHYYEAINATAASITDHHEKQKFLKVLYENFYKAYNPKAADRLGVVYTPNEIVNFMVQGTDYLLHKHFGKTLANKNVEILDPATGTGTFLTSIIDYIAKQDLAYKYKNEIHANEVAILPYYIANLNIEFTFKQKMGYYEEYKNLCFVDTLDNTDALNYEGKQHDLFGLSNENTERILRQNSKRISVIIGNPPYNANQKNENENNKNREYPFVDKRIKNTYIKYSTAQKTKLYDMYSRFYRWASDRLDKNGILTFITNRSFIDSRTFDGFRKCIFEDFSACYIIDTKSDVRANLKIAGTTHNVFGIQTGVAIMFLVKKEKAQRGCKIEYVALDDFWRKEEKLAWLKNQKIENIHFQEITPDKNNNWINLVDNDFDSLLPLADKNVKLGKSKEAVFGLFSLGTVSNRDDWVCDFDKKTLMKKVDFFINEFNESLQRKNKDNSEDIINNSPIKFTRDLKKHFANSLGIEVKDSEFRDCHYRVFTKRHLYYASELNEMRYQTPLIFPTKETQNVIIAINQSKHPFNILASNILVDLHFNGDSQCFPLYRFDNAGNCKENITDWGLQQFINHYQDETIKKEYIFYYTYAVLHSPTYRKKYELNLKREFPRLPFYENFCQWAEWGKALIDLHINYETAVLYPLQERSHEVKTITKLQKEMYAMAAEPEALYIHQPKNKVKLVADKSTGIIEIDELTYLTGIPSEAWEYKLGNRSALEWVLDQYKEKKPKDPTIAEKFNTYRFADYKEKVIDKLKRVCTVSVETVRIIKEMEASANS
jgi:predicted helicase